MNKFQELFDQLRDTFMARWEQFQDTDLYISLRDRYDNLSPRGQKVTLFAACAFVFLMFFSVPQSWFGNSQANISSFEDTKNTIQELLAVTQESKSIPALSKPLTGPELRGSIERLLAEESIAKDQIVNLSETQFSNPQGSTLIPPKVSAGGIELTLKKLNLKQIIELGYGFDRISPLVKTLSLEVSATPEDVHYYNVSYRIASFSVMDPTADSPQNSKKGR